MRALVLRLARYLIASALVLITGLLAWLYVDAHRDRDSWLSERSGQLVAIDSQQLTASPGLLAEQLTLRSDSGLQTVVRVLRPSAFDERLPVLILLGGHRTGADAVELFRNVENFAVIALDYPYAGPQQSESLLDKIRALPAIRQTFLDAAPALSLTASWALQQSWADPDKLIAVGVSLGVPFAATAAARDTRFSGLMLVHGAGNNRSWLKHNVARRIDLGPLLTPASHILHWYVYGPLHDTVSHVTAMAPRPVIIVGARNDERSPAGDTEQLYAAAREPRKLVWTAGRHVQPGRREIIDELLAIARAEISTW